MGGDDVLSHAVAGSPFVRLMRPKCGGSAARVGDVGVLCWFLLAVGGLLVFVDLPLVAVDVRLF